MVIWRAASYKQSPVRGLCGHTSHPSTMWSSGSLPPLTNDPVDGLLKVVLLSFKDTNVWDLTGNVARGASAHRSVYMVQEVRRRFGKAQMFPNRPGRAHCE